MTLLAGTSNLCRSLAFEGKARIAALRAILGPEDEVLVEVELDGFRDPRKAVRRLARVRRLNQLLPERKPG